MEGGTVGEGGVNDAKENEKENEKGTGKEGIGNWKGCVHGDSRLGG